MTKLLNVDMIKECLSEFNKNLSIDAQLCGTYVSHFDINLKNVIYKFNWDGTFIGDHGYNYVGDELQRLFTARLNSIDHSTVDAPNHYTLPSGKQLIELLQSDLLTRKEFIGFCKGNVYKYVARYQQKNHREDLEKAKQYLNFLEGLDNGQNENE